MLHQLTRREAIQTATALGISTLVSGTQAEEKPSPKKPQLITFTKPFQHLSYQELAKLIAEVGFDGIEAPIRSGGHIVPEQVEVELPKMVDALDAEQLKIGIMASSINSVDSPNAEITLKTAKKLGVPYYRMAYYRYDLKKPIQPQLANFKAQAADLAAMNKEIGITGIYQNHSGDRYLGAPLWDLHEILKDYPPTVLASGFDIGHATIEGGKSWPIQQNLLQDYLAAAYIKDFTWQGTKSQWVPLGEGNISPKFFESLVKQKFNGPVSLHVEYLDHKDHSNQSKFVQGLRNDLKTLKQLLKLT